MISEAAGRRTALLDFLWLWKGKLVRSLRLRGVLGTVRYAAFRAGRWVADRWIRYRDERFDRRFGINTAGDSELPDWHSDPRFQYSIPYWPTPPSVFFRALRHIDADFSNFVFIDFGCGKGKVLLLAGELPFKRVIGVEMSPVLIRVAEDNLRACRNRTRRCNAFELVCADAAEYQIPHEPAVYYFYNPFRAEAMGKVLDRIRRSLAAVPREAYVVYVNPVHQNLLDESGFLTPMKRTSWYSIYRVSGVSRMGVPQERSAAAGRSWKEKFLRSLHCRGLAGTVKWGAVVIAYRIRNRFPGSWDDCAEWRFDRKFAVDTRGTLHVPEAGAVCQQAPPYVASSQFFFRRMMRLLPGDHCEFTFVDIGCGKGKALLLASEWPFRRIVGVEISPALLAIAERNIATYRNKKRQCCNFQLVLADARAYEIPPGDAVLYFFHPFSGPVARTVFENIGRSVAQCPREVFIIYNHPVHRTMMDTLPFLTLVRALPWYVIYRVVPSVAGPSEAGGQARTGAG